MDLNVCKLVYHYVSNSEERLVDVDLFSYLEMLGDIYNSVLSYIPVRRSVTFCVKYVTPGKTEDIDVKSDEDLLKMFDVMKDQEYINMYIYNVQMTDLVDVTYVNGHALSVLGGDTVSNRPVVEKPLISLGSASTIVASEIASRSSEEPTKMITTTEWLELQDPSDSSDDWQAGDSDELIEEDEINDEDVDDEVEKAAENEDNIEDEYSECEPDGPDDMIAKGMNSNPKIELAVGQYFDNVNHFRQVLKDYQVQEGFIAMMKKNEKNRVTAICEEPGCAWRIHASPLARDGITYEIKTINDNHTCQRGDARKTITASWIVSKIGSKIKADPKMSVETMRQILKEQYNVETSDMRLYRARRKAISEVDGTHLKSYYKLANYGKLIKEKNKGNAFLIQYQNGDTSGQEVNGVVVVNPKFKRLFMCFDACRNGFVRGCRPFIGLDGCHLKGYYGGVLVSAVSVDGNNGMFPIAYGVVESEGKDSWLFFLYHLKQSIETCMETTKAPYVPITFMTDKQKGLIEAISTIFLEANHRHCSRHLYNNFKKLFGNGPALRKSFWAATRAYNVLDFEKAMEGMKREKKVAYDWLMKTPVSMWSRHAFDHRSKSDHITNNVSESFNHWVGSCREKPILTLVDQIRIKIMGRLQKRLTKGCNFIESITPRIRRRLDEQQKGARYCSPISAGNNMYEVQDSFRRYVVDIGNLSCDCGVYVASGLPCRHVGACLRYTRIPMPVKEYVDHYFSRERYILTYHEMIDPMPDPSSIEDVELLPPFIKRPTGRPHKSRKREPDEPLKENIRKRSSTIRCGKCKAFNHNRRSCKGGPIKEKLTSSSKSTSETRCVKRKQITNSQDESSSQRITWLSQQSSTSALATDQEKILHKRSIKNAKERARVASKASKAIQ